MTTWEITSEERLSGEAVNIYGKWLADPLTVWQWFLEMIARLGLTVLATQYHVFPNGALSGTVLLAESHAAVHTWPEHDLGWCELVTCGDPDACKKFAMLCRRAPDKGD